MYNFVVYVSLGHKGHEEFQLSYDSHELPELNLLAHMNIYMNDDFYIPGKSYKKTHIKITYILLLLFVYIYTFWYVLLNTFYWLTMSLSTDTWHLIYNKPTLDQVMAWRHKATSHYWKWYWQNPRHHQEPMSLPCVAPEKLLKGSLSINSISPCGNDPEYITVTSN